MTFSAGAVTLNIINVGLLVAIFFIIMKKYRKRPCISCTFFQKIEVKNQGCGLSMDTSVFGVLKNLLNIHKTS